MSSAGRLLFVHNADNGFFNTMADIGHKLFAPDTHACALCALTHGCFSERNQFLNRYPAENTESPAVFALDGTNLRPAAAMRDCPDLPAL